jgi:hypothetical protein
MSLESGGDAALDGAVASGDVSALQTDLQDNFNLGESSTPYLRADLEMPSGWNLEVSGFRYDDSSNSTLAQRFGDIPVGTAVDAKLRVTNVKIALLKDIIDTDVAELSAGLALNYFDVDMDVTSLTAQIAPDTTFEQTNFEAPVPMLYVRGAVDIALVRGELSAGWLSADLGDAKGHFFDVDAMVSVSLTAVDLFAGYRFISLDAEGQLDGQDFETHTRLAGWYLGGGVTF